MGIVFRVIWGCFPSNKRDPNSDLMESLTIPCTQKMFEKCAAQAAACNVQSNKPNKAKGQTMKASFGADSSVRIPHLIMS